WETSRRARLPERTPSADMPGAAVQERRGQPPHSRTPNAEAALARAFRRAGALPRSRLRARVRYTRKDYVTERAGRQAGRRGLPPPPARQETPQRLRWPPPSSDRETRSADGSSRLRKSGPQIQSTSTRRETAKAPLMSLLS